MASACMTVLTPVDLFCARTCITLRPRYAVLSSDVRLLGASDRDSAGTGSVEGTGSVGVTGSPGDTGSAGDTGSVGATGTPGFQVGRLIDLVLERGETGFGSDSAAGGTAPAGAAGIQVEK
jgi:hypothetical protein